MPDVFSVTDFIGSVNDIIAGEFVVEGEVSNFKISQGKWVFFDLKDERSCLNCFSTLYMLRTPLEDGMRVQALGYPKIYDKTGRFSFTVQKAAPVGVGSLQRAYLLLKEKLTAEGVFNPERKRTLPELPERIGVIASRDSAAFGDFMRILNSRWGGVEVVLRHVTVQGETAVEEITAAFNEFNQSQEACDLVVLIRGGGSLEDLAAFNTEEVVRAVYGSRLPVVAGVGHERDETLVDFAADVRAATPTHAAELVVPDRAHFLKNIEQSVSWMQERLEYAATLRTQSVERSMQSLNHFFDSFFQRGIYLVERMRGGKRLLDDLLTAQFRLVEQAEKILMNVHPKRVLSRGYSIVRKRSGEIVKNAKSVDRGESLVLELGTGEISATVE
jgi:exodeoxyribonuclease VII large subunit